MKVTNIDEDLLGPMSEPMIFDQVRKIVDEVEVLVDRFWTIRRALASICLFTGKNAQLSNAPEMLPEDGVIVFGINQALVKSATDCVDSVDIISEQITYSKKMGFHCLHAIVFGHLCEAFKKAENPEPESSGGLAMSNPPDLSE